MVPVIPSSPSINNSPGSNSSRNKSRRKNKNKRQKKQQKQPQILDILLPLESDKIAHDDKNDNNQKNLIQSEDRSPIKGVTITTINRDDSNLSADNNNDQVRHNDSTSSGNTIDGSNIINNDLDDDVVGAVNDSHFSGRSDINEDNQQSNKDCSKIIEDKSSPTSDKQETDLEVSNDSYKIIDNVNEMAIASYDKIKVNDPATSAAKPESNAQEDESERKKKLLRLKLREYRKLRARFESQESQMTALTDHMRQQANKIKDLEGLVLSTKKTCNQMEKLLQNEVACRKKLEQEKTILCQTVNRLKTQIGIYEKNKLTNDELMRTINATLMERDTEVSMLKLKLTRLQTNQSFNQSSNGLPTTDSDINDKCHQERNDPSKAFILAGRSNSEFSRNSPLRSTMIADCSTRSSITQLRSIDNDSSVWASIPPELTPSRRPQLLEKSFQAIYNESKHNQQPNSTSTPLTRDKRYKTLPPRSIIKVADREQQSNQTSHENGHCDITTKSNDIMQQLSSSTHPNTTNGYKCQVTNLDDSSTSGNRSSSTTNSGPNQTLTTSKLEKDQDEKNQRNLSNINSQRDKIEPKHLYDTIGLPEVKEDQLKSDTIVLKEDQSHSKDVFIRPAPVDRESEESRPRLMTTQAIPTPLTPSKKVGGFKRIFDRFRRSDSNSSKTSDFFDDLLESTSKQSSSPFKRDSNRATLVGLPGDGRAQMSPKQQKISFQTDKPFAEWDTDMIVEWLTMIGLSMYSNQCRRWVKCGAHIMNATPAEVDKGLGITNHLHRKKLRLAISELNGDCDKVTKAAAKLDYLWIARWLDDLGLPQYKEAFINARVDGRVLNYLTIEDLISLGVKSVLHHASIKSGIRVLRSANFDLQLLKRRATSEEIDEMNIMRQQINQINDTVQKTISLRQAVSGINNGDQSNVRIAHGPHNDLALWTCHRIMEWLRLIDFAEFAPNLRGSGVHGGLLVFEDGFNFDTMCCLLSIPLSRTLLRRHLSSYFDALLGKDLVAKKRTHSIELSHPHLNPFDEIKTPKKTTLWPLTKLKSSSKNSQSGMDDYLVPMYPMEPSIIKTTSNAQTSDNSRQHLQQANHLRNDINIHSTPLAKIPESVNV